MARYVAKTCGVINLMPMNNKYSILTLGVTHDRLQPVYVYGSLCLRLCQLASLGSRTGKTAVAAAVPASRQLDEENVERTETLSGVIAGQSTVA